MCEPSSVRGNKFSWKHMMQPAKSHNKELSTQGAVEPRRSRPCERSRVTGPSQQNHEKKHRRWASQVAGQQLDPTQSGKGTASASCSRQAFCRLSVFALGNSASSWPPCRPSLQTLRQRTICSRSRALIPIGPFGNLHGPYDQGRSG
jgi:hypothetical protein